MKNYIHKKGAKLLAIAALSLVLLVFIAVLYTAYIYYPKRIVYKSEYLASVESKYLKLDGYNAHYIQSGEGKPVIFIHGGGSWLYSFRDNIPYISKSFSTYAIDMPGHGYTEVLSRDPKYDLDMYCEFILDFIDKQQIDRVSLVGNSWGGGWALYFAEKHPERVDKLILIDSSGLAFRDVFEWEVFKIPIIGEAFSKFINFDSVKLSLKKVFFNQGKVDEIMINEILNPLQNENNRKAQYLAERNLNWKITAENINKITCPTLVIWGKEDKYLDLHYAYEFQNKINGAELLIINECGHVAHEDCPEIINNAILEFLKK